MEKKIMKVEVGGKEIIFETGKIARQANGSVIVRCGETMVFCAASSSKTPENTDFLTLNPPSVTGASIAPGT